MSDVSAMSDGQLIMKLVMQGFRSRDTESREVAAEFFIRRGVELVPNLAREAMNTKHKPELRIRALELIARIGPPYGEELLDLQMLLHTPNKLVREAARNLFGFSALVFGTGNVV